MNLLFTFMMDILITIKTNLVAYNEVERENSGQTIQKSIDQVSFPYRGQLSIILILSRITFSYVN